MWTFSQKVSNTGKLSGVKQPRPPDGCFLNLSIWPENRSWQKASAEHHIWAKSSPTMNSGDSGP